MSYIKLEVVNGYWHLNDKPLQFSSYAKKCFFDKLITLKKVKQPIALEGTFKSRAQQIKQMFNHEFNFK